MELTLTFNLGDRVLARCKEEGADPRLQPYERRYFIVRLLMEFEQDL